MDVKKKQFDGSVKIDRKVLSDAKKICKSKGKLIYMYITEAVKNHNKLEK